MRLRINNFQPRSYVSDVPTTPGLKPREISESERAQILRMKETSDWWIRTKDPSEFEPSQRFNEILRKPQN